MGKNWWVTLVPEKVYGSLFLEHTRQAIAGNTCLRKNVTKALVQHQGQVMGPELDVYSRIYLNFPPKHLLIQ